MSSITETYGASSTFTGVLMDPEKLTIVGEDCPADVCPDLVDQDPARLVPDLAMQLSLAKHGNRVAIEIKKVGDLIFVVNGRRRVRNARLANARLKGSDAKIRLRCIVAEKGSDVFSSMIIANEHALIDSPIARARKIQQTFARGSSSQEVQDLFGLSKQTVDNLLTLLEAPAIVKAVEQGKLPVSTAVTIAKMSPTKQAEALPAAIAAGKGAKAAEAIERVKQGRPQREPSDKADTRRPLKASTLAELQEILSPNAGEDGQFSKEESEGGLEIAYALVRVIRGEPTKLLGDWPVLQKAVRKVVRSPKVEK